MNEREADVHYRRGLRVKASRGARHAIQEFRLAVEHDPGHAEAHQELGWAIFGTEGDLEEARMCLETAIDLEPSLGDAHMYLGLVLSRLGRPDDSEVHFRMALSLTDNPALAHVVFAEALLWRNQRYGEAEQHFRIGLEHDPTLALGLRDYARMLTSHGRDSEAKEYFERALDVDPNDKWTIRAYEAFCRNQVAPDRDPDERLRDAIRRDPHYIGGIQWLAGKGGESR